MSGQQAKERLDTRTSSDRLQIVLHNQRYEFVLQNLSRLESVLEIGTGEGNLSVLLAKKCSSYVGLEFDAESCRVTSERLAGAYRVVHGDARAMAFAPRTFSGIVCLEVLEHLGDFEAGVRNIHRCLREDGMAIISVPYRRQGGPSATNPYHVYEPGERELITVLRRYFDVVRVQFQYFDETIVMKAARLLHIRRLLGIEGIYRALSNGEPEAISRLKLGPFPSGMKMHLILVVERPKVVFD
jgi:SAM-dependent methyltransferase